MLLDGIRIMVSQGWIKCCRILSSFPTQELADHGDTTPPSARKKQQSTDDGVPFGCGEKWRGKQGRFAERRKTVVGVQWSSSSHQQKLVGSLDNNDDKKKHKQTADDGG
jgi:hypothetical protein